MVKRSNVRLIGERFGFLTPIALCPSHTKHLYYLCLCDCGNVCIVKKGNLLKGITISCGCYGIEQLKIGAENLHKNPIIKHGYYHTRLYKIWGQIIQRCTNPNDAVYHRYGGRGISICEEWRDAKQFCDWAMSNGYAEGLSIDRIDNSMGYFPSNCRWVDSFVQANNTRKNVYIEVDGVSHTRTEWARILGINPESIRWVQRKGDDAAEFIRKKLSL